MTLRQHTRTAAALALAALGLAACGGPSMLEKLASPELMYKEGERSLRVGNYDHAIRIYEALEIAHPFSPVTKQAQLDLAYAYYRNRQPESAVDAADQFIRENPRHPHVDYAHYLKGLVYFERDRNFLEKIFRVDLTKRPPDDAYNSFANFAVLVARFPESEYAADARQRMVFLRNRLADYEVHVARYYLKRGAFVAAANRAKYVVDNYQEAPAVQKALELMAESYARLGMDELAYDSRRVLAENFSDRKYAELVRPGSKVKTRVPISQTELPEPPALAEAALEKESD